MNNYKNLLFLLCLLFTQNIKGINNDSYLKTFDELENMLSNDFINLKRAVFLTENAYLEDKFTEEEFNNVIAIYSSICQGIQYSGNIIYPEIAKEKAVAQCAALIDTYLIIKINNNLRDYYAYLINNSF